LIEYYFLWVLFIGICVYAWIKKDKDYLIPAALVGIFIIINALDISWDVKVWMIVGLTLLFFVSLIIKVLLYARRIK